MADFSEIVQAIDENIVPRNHARAITGEKLNGVMKVVVEGVNELKQDTIEDLPEIREGAELGATALQEVPDTYRPSAEQDTIDNAIKGRLNTIEGVIPSEASPSNKVADKDFVNSSVATNTAYFRGTFDLVNDLHLTEDATEMQIAAALALAITVVTNNDYAFVFFENETTGIAEYYDRYKYSTEDGWGFEYRLNNSSFTAAQWAAINSGLTSGDKAALDAALAFIETFGDIVTHNASEFMPATEIDSTPTTDSSNLVTSGGVKAYVDEYGGDTSELQEAAAAALNDLWYQLLSGARKSILREDVVDSLDKAWSEKPLSARQGVILNGKFDLIHLVTAAALNDLNNAKAFMEAVAPPFSGQKIYSVGQYCTELGKLWKCDTAYTEAEPVFDASKWHTTTIVEEFLTTE